MAINRQDPQFVSGQVNQVAESLIHTEETMNELRFATGLDPTDDAAQTSFPGQLRAKPAFPLPSRLVNPAEASAAAPRTAFSFFSGSRHGQPKLALESWR